MSGPRRPSGPAIALGAALLGAWLLAQLHPYREITEHGPTAQALANPYLAAERFLRHQGLDIRRDSGLAALPSHPDGEQTLLLLGARARMSPHQAARVLEWTAAGGHLVFVAERLWDEKTARSGDPLLDELGIRQYLSANLSIGEDGILPQAELTRFYPPGEQTPAYLAFDNAYHLYDSRHRAYAWANSDTTTHLLQVPYGRGSATVLSDARIWENPHIGAQDHAWLLWYLSRGSQVTLIQRAAGEGLTTLLMRHFPATLLALALLLGSLLWHAGRRQGPPLPGGRPARRRLEEHLRTTAEFQLRHGGHGRLLQILQHDIRRRAGQREPRFAELPEEAQWQLLARLGQQPSAQIEQLMRPLDKQALPAAEFTRRVAGLQRLRNAL